MRQRVLLKCSKLEEHWYLGCLYLGRKKKKISTSYVKVMKLQSNQNQYYSIKSMYWYTEIKGLVHPKMKIASWFTHPQAILGVYDFVLSDEYNLSYIKNFLAFPSFIMAVNGHRDFVQKVHLSIVKSAPHWLWVVVACALMREWHSSKWRWMQKLRWEYASLVRTKFCLQQRKN